MITKIVITSYIDGGEPTHNDDTVRMIMGTAAADALALGIVVDITQTDEAPTDIDALPTRLRNSTLYDPQTRTNLMLDAADALEETQTRLATKEAWIEAWITGGEDAFNIERAKHIEAVRDMEAAESLGARAAKLVAMMLQQAGRYLTSGYGEINEVLMEARQRGWLEPISDG